MVGEAHQYRIRRDFLDGKRSWQDLLFESEEDRELRLANFPLEKAIMRPITRDVAEPFIETYEYLGNIAAIYTAGYGLYWGIRLGAVCIFSLPSAKQMTLCCGEENSDKVAQLTRGACAFWTPPNTSSFLISRALNALEKETPYRVVIAYADPRAGEIGTVYQATNWLYTGLGSGGTDWAPSFAAWDDYHYHTRSLPKWLKSKHRIEERGWEAIAVPRPLKHRYIHILGSRTERKELLAALKYPLSSYPKRVAAAVVEEEEGVLEEEGIVSVQPDAPTSSTERPRETQLGREVPTVLAGKQFMFDFEHLGG